MNFAIYNRLSRSLYQGAANYSCLFFFPVGCNWMLFTSYMIYEMCCSIFVLFHTHPSIFVDCISQWLTEIASCLKFEFEFELANEQLWDWWYIDSTGAYSVKCSGDCFLFEIWIGKRTTMGLMIHWSYWDLFCWVFRRTSFMSLRSIWHGGPATKILNLGEIFFRFL